ncbi:hypothetical protein SporoP33_14330 [Sporosarcina sp. P33]|nr:hypothetical protein SporoP33_14330 [Sporosarcina sp. P33]
MRPMNVKWIISYLVLFLLCTPVMPAVYAETDPDISVSECIGKGKDCSDKAPAAEGDKPTVTDKELAGPTGLTAGDYIRTLLAFLFVIGLLVWLLRFLNRRNRSFDQTRLMTNLGGVPLGQNKSIQLVKMGSHYFVVGVGENVQLLREIDDPHEIEELLARYDQGNEVQKGILSQLYSRFSAKGKNPYAEDESTVFSQVFSSKMEEIKTERKEQLDRLKRKGSDQNG